MLFQRPRLVFARDVDALRDSRENQSLNYAPEDMDAAKTKAAEDAYIGPDEWLKSAPKFEGSWWPEWAKWLTAQSGELCEPPRMGPVQANDEKLPDAPGDYVRR